MIDEMKQDAMENVVDTILDDPKTQEMIKVAEPFIKPTMKGLLKELGPDINRLMLFYDNQTGQLVFWRIKTDNIKEFELNEAPKKEDMFFLDPKDIEKGNIKDIIKVIIKKLGIKFM